MPNAIAIIPARGGSKRLKRKNIMPFHGLPLLAHSIRYAQQFPHLIAKVLVSTEDAEIKKTALDYGAQVIDRPLELAGDLTSTLEVLQHALQYIPSNIEYLITLQATNPLRQNSLLPDCMQKIRNSSAQSLFSISPAPKKVGTLNSQSNFIPLNYKAGARSQDIPDLFFENGLIYITHRDLIAQGIIFDEHSLTHIVSDPSGQVDIDTEEDFRYGLHMFKEYTTQTFEK